jgi:RsiW-degrading membrane proteinase PrsW (M82 family)
MADQAIGTTAHGRHRRQWLRLFLVGLVFWAASVVVTFWTANPNLVPTVILLGSFLVPVTFVVDAFERHADQVVTTQRIFTSFVRRRAWGAWRVDPGGGVPQAAVDRHLSGCRADRGGGQAGRIVAAGPAFGRSTMRDGIVLGATVGFGFAALESAGYAFNALFTMEGLSLQNLVETEVLRGLLTPVGHGLWTAILGGVLFRSAARSGRARLSGGLVGWYLVVALLHALWDASRPIAVWLTLLLTATQVQWLLIRLGRVPQPTQAQVHTLTTITWALLLLDAVLGVAVLRGRWRQALVLDRAQSASRLAPGPAA